MIRITNSLTRTKEDFVPLKAGEVQIYVCGPTVYGLTHVGNARPNLFFDIVRRFLEFRGFKVNLVSNYTDVDDKIINKAREEKCDSLEISEKFIAAFLEDMAALGVRPPDSTPKVTDHIAHILKLIGALVENESAYVVEDGEVFFAVRKFKAYGKLSGKNIDDLLVGVRVQPGERKRDPLDFSLWKPQKAADEPAWDSPWGKGRPGWHIECSAMALHYLGETFDIHGGGIDLMHPHHENEIAQAEAVTGKTFARVWMHNNLVAIDNEKMSKSVGNIFLNRDFIRKYTAETLRFLLLSGHYRSPIDFSERHIRETQAALHRFYSTVTKAELHSTSQSKGPTAETKEEGQLKEIGSTFEARWIEAMEDDFNTAKIVGIVFEYVRALNAYFDRSGFKPSVYTSQIANRFLGNRKTLSEVLSFLGESPAEFLETLRMSVLDDRSIAKDAVEAKIQERNEARKQKDFATADRVRDELQAMGISIKDFPSGTVWDVVFTESV